MSLVVRKNKSSVPNCPLYQCMAIIGGAWTANIIWYLSAGPRRFNELRNDLTGISAKVLTTRLKDLTHRGVLIREVKPTSPPSVEYSLTEEGHELMPAIKAILKVGEKLKKSGHCAINQKKTHSSESNHA